MPDALTDPILAIAVPFIAAKEDFRATPYQDQRGRWTYGHGFTFLENGRPVTEHTPPITREASYARLIRLVAATLTKVQDMTHRPLTTHQAAALTSFAYNCGTGALRSSTLLRLFEQGDVQGAADQFRVWIYAGGSVSNGLRKRRDEERAMFLTPDAQVSPRLDQVGASVGQVTADDLNAAELRRVRGQT